MGNSAIKDEDRILIQRCLGGDAQASRRLFDKYCDRLYRLAYRYLGNREDALDAAQQAFINAFASLDRFEGQSELFTWLVRITINAALDVRRQRSRQPAESHPESELLETGRQEGRAPVLRPEQVAQQHELEQALREAVERLPEPQRSVFVLYTFEEMSYKEIAQALEISIGTVMSRLHYARLRLQESLRNYL